MSAHYCLRWNNHQNNMINIFHDLLKKEAFTDVTLAVENRTIKCHKLILAACSPYLRKILEESPCKHPTIIFKDIQYIDLQALIDFMYNGEVNIMQDQLAGLLMTAEFLKVKGLVDMNSRDDDKTPTQLRDVSPPPAISTTNRDTVMASSSSVHSSPPHSTYSDRSQYLPRTDTISYFYRPPAVGLNTSPECTTHHNYEAYDNLIGRTLTETFNKNRLKLSDTPILRTALGQNSLLSSALDNLHYYHNHPMNNMISTSIDLTHRRESPLSPPDIDEEEKKSPKQREPTKEKSTDLPAKPEWKRYKQYTRAEIDAAITAVKEGMSAVQAAH
ncbi:protein abrupt-like isoform X2 [Pseudomyrmex gracilis]|uniref:protein abrupt-like isoform X2 n=1 Tax=Pseudomyrmex gracilis TaxID=219809 RepID=UPI000995DEBF|nr:protein abrupt-like isoform X2 [Pseudomyrmex gracilis]